MIIKVKNKDWVFINNELTHHMKELQNKNRELAWFKTMCVNINSHIDSVTYNFETAFNTTESLVQKLYKNYLLLIQENKDLKERVKQLEEDFPK